MKANNKIDDPDVVTTTVAEEQPLLKPAVIDKKFQAIGKMVDKMRSYASELVIDTDESLEIAKNNASKVNDMLKRLDDERKKLKDPYYRTSQMIDTMAKEISDPLKEIKSDINNAITDFKRVQQAAAKAQADKIRKEAEELADKKAAEADRINRIESQLVARLYGGFWFNSAGEKKTSSGCAKYKDCDAIKDAVQNRIPSVDQFEHLQDDYKKMKKIMLKRISKHKSNMIELESDSKAIRDAAQEKIDQAKREAGLEITTKKEERTQEIVKEAKNEMKSADKEIKDAGKGVRKNLRFEIADVSEVPLNWLILNEKAVREWVSENKDELKAQLEMGKNTVKGLKFWIEDVYVSR